MNLLRRIARRLRHLFRRGQAEAEMREEMAFHLEQRAADLASDGMAATEARYAARKKFGNLGSIEEQAREGRGWGWLERALKDLHLAGRQLARNPGFSVLAIVTLGLGIGANTSMFSVLNGILLKPLPYSDSDQLKRFYRATAQTQEGHFSAADWLDFQQTKAGYGDTAAYTAGNASLADPGRPAEMVYAGRSTANLLSLLGVTPQLGRDFRAGEDTPGRDRIVILSQRTWRNRFGGRADIVGSTIRIDGEPHEVIGVLPAAFNDWRHLGMVDLFRPLALTPAQAADRHTLFLRVIGRQAKERSAAEAAAFVANFGTRLAEEFPAANAASTWRTVPLSISTAGGTSTVVLPMLIGLSGFVLLIACSNLANLLLARTMARSRELAVRAALGASRLQLLRPLIAEALLLALAGGALAIIVALWSHDWFAARSTGDNGEQVVFTLDWVVAGWAFAVSLVTAVVFGIAPALFALRLNLNATLKSGGRGLTGGRGQQRFRAILIVGQFALAMILFAGAGLFVRGLHDLNNRRAGWESERLLTGTVLLPVANYADGAAMNAFHRLVRERLGALPGVEAVSVSMFTPFFDWAETRKFMVEGRERPALGREPAAIINSVSPGYFATYGTRLLAGREFDARDHDAAAPVFVISQATARGLFGTENPLGRRLAQAGGDTIRWGEIIGVVTDIASVMPDPNPVTFQIYTALAQDPRRQNEIAVRAAGIAPAALLDRIRNVMAELDPDLPVRRLQPADVTILRANYQLGVLRDMLVAFAILGLGLASLGIYGVIARTMAQRAGEFAIRLALGASIEHVTRLVLTAGAKLALVGAAFGLLGAMGVSRLLASQFPGVVTNGAPVLIATTFVLGAMALLACWLPARRAGRVDAVAVLRAE